MIYIFRPSGDLLATVEVDDKSYRYKAIMGDDALTLYFSTAEHLEIPLGSFVDFQGGHYIGKVVYVKSLFNTVVVRPPEGTHIWTKEKRSEYAVNAGEEARFVYLHLNDKTKYWICSCYSFT